MSGEKKRGPGRPKGSGLYTEKLLLGLTPGQRQDYEAAAKREGVTLTEWLRRAAAAYLAR